MNPLSTPIRVMGGEQGTQAPRSPERSLTFAVREFEPCLTRNSLRARSRECRIAFVTVPITARMGVHRVTDSSVVTLRREGSPSKGGSHLRREADLFEGRASVARPPFEEWVPFVPADATTAHPQPKREKGSNATESPGPRCNRGNRFAIRAARSTVTRQRAVLNHAPACTGIIAQTIDAQANKKSLAAATEVCYAGSRSQTSRSATDLFRFPNHRGSASTQSESERE